MSRKFRIMSPRSFSLLAAAAIALFAGQAVAGNKPTQPLTPAACVAAGIKPPVGFLSYGPGFPSNPNVKFDFGIANTDSRCSATSVKVTWLYHLADRKTQANVKTVNGSDTFPQVLQKNWQHLYVNCTPPGANTYCKDASATISPGSSYVIIAGKGSASVGPLKP